MTVGILTGCACFGQTLSVGLIGGARASDDLTGAGATGVSKRYVIGPAVDIGLALGFGVEVDALYRREGYQTSFGSFAYNIFSGERANSWEFPITQIQNPVFISGSRLRAAGDSRIDQLGLHATFPDVLTVTALDP